MEPISIVKAKHIKGFEVELMFDNGVTAVVNLEPYLEGEVFAPLKDVSYFKSFKLDSWTLNWENGADFAPEFLYDLAVSRNKKVG
jgi:hypothetical protein